MVLGQEGLWSREGSGSGLSASGGASTRRWAPGQGQTRSPSSMKAWRGVAEPSESPCQARATGKGAVMVERSKSGRACPRQRRPDNFRGNFRTHDFVRVFDSPCSIHYFQSIYSTLTPLLSRPKCHLVLETPVSPSPADCLARLLAVIRPSPHNRAARSTSEVCIEAWTATYVHQFQDH